MTRKSPSPVARYIAGIKTGKSKPRRGDIGILSTPATGCPLVGDGTFDVRLARGLNLLRAAGWSFVTVNGNSFYFRRTR